MNSNQTEKQNKTKQNMEYRFSFGFNVNEQLIYYIDILYTLNKIVLSNALAIIWQSNKQQQLPSLPTIQNQKTSSLLNIRRKNNRNHRYSALFKYCTSHRGGAQRKDTRKMRNSHSELTIPVNRQSYTPLSLTVCVYVCVSMRGRAIESKAREEKNNLFVARHSL